MRYVISLKRGIAEKNASDWREIVKNTQGVVVIGDVTAKRLFIEAGFDAIGVLLHKLGSICHVERSIDHDRNEEAGR